MNASVVLSVFLGAAVVGLAVAVAALVLGLAARRRGQSPAALPPEPADGPSDAPALPEEA